MSRGAYYCHVIDGSCDSGASSPRPVRPAAMKMRALGPLNVSVVCLGTMTWGTLSAAAVARRMRLVSCLPCSPSAWRALLWGCGAALA